MSELIPAGPTSICSCRPGRVSKRSTAAVDGLGLEQEVASQLARASPARPCAARPRSRARAPAPPCRTTSALPRCCRKRSVSQPSGPSCALTRSGRRWGAVCLITATSSSPGIASPPVILAGGEARSGLVRGPSFRGRQFPTTSGAQIRMSPGTGTVWRQSHRGAIVAPLASSRRRVVAASTVQGLMAFPGEHRPTPASPGEFCYR